MPAASAKEPSAKAHMGAGHSTLVVERTRMKVRGR